MKQLKNYKSLVKLIYFNKVFKIIRNELICSVRGKISTIPDMKVQKPSKTHKPTDSHI